MLVGGVIVEDDVDGLAGGNLALDGVEEADELLMAVALHAAADHRAVEHVERGEQGGRAVALVIVGHGSGAALLHRQARLGAVERLDLAFFVERQDDGVGRRIDVEPDDVAQLLDEFGSLESLNWRTRCGCSPWARQMRWTELTLMPTASAISAPVQWVVSPGGSLDGQRHDALGHPGPSGAMREGRVLSRRRPSNALRMNRSCQRQTQVLDLPVWRMISLVPSALGRKQHDLGSPDVLLRRVAVLDQSLKPIHVGRSDGKGNAGAHVAQTRTPRVRRESPSGIKMSDLIHSHVRRFKLQARIFFCSRSSVSIRPPLGMARGTIMRTTVDHALIRGLVAAGPVMRRGASSV